MKGLDSCLFLAAKCSPDAVDAVGLPAFIFTPNTFEQVPFSFHLETKYCLFQIFYSSYIRYKILIGWRLSVLHYGYFSMFLMYDSLVAESSFTTESSETCKGI